MFSQRTNNIDKALLDAIDLSSAIIHFTPDGTILDANKNFLNALGYTLDEIKGKHHRIFCDPSYTSTQEYKNFWQKLGNGETQIAEYRRITKSGNEIWIQASYNSVKDTKGNVIRVIKVATDITAEVKRRIDTANTLAQAANAAVIEKALDSVVTR